LNNGPPLSAERLAADLELDGQHRAFRLAMYLLALFPVAADAPDPGILEDGRIELRCFLGLGVEPQAWDDLLHG
jgi:hypothetical protein